MQPPVGAGAPPLRVAILGFGNVARAVCKLLAAGHGKAANGDSAFALVALASRRRGVAFAETAAAGLDPARLAGDLRQVPWRSWPHGWSGVEFAREVSADVLVELTTLDVADGQPAIGHIDAALRSGKHVVTANKGPLAWDYGRLAALAAGMGRKFLHEAAVMDGAPVFNLHRHCLRGCRVTAVRGILNSTTNVILSAMDEGRGYAEALAEAQRQGIAEADPALDVDGWDAAVKLCALANVMMDAGISPPTVDRTGVRGVTAADMAAARDGGETIRLIASAERDLTGAVRATVSPQRVARDGVYGQVKGTSSLLTIETDLLGSLTLTEQDPQLPQTAYGVLADLLEIAVEHRL